MKDFFGVSGVVTALEEWRVQMMTGMNSRSLLILDFSLPLL